MVTYKITERRVRRRLPRHFRRIRLLLCLHDISHPILKASLSSN
jgi:hypothetical protein